MKGKKISSCLMLAVVLALGAAGCGKTEKEPDFSQVQMEVLRTDAPARTSMRSLTASEDGAYLYGGYIKGEPRGVYKMDADTGEDIWYYQDKGYSQPGFCKGVAVDDRGYVYVGVTIWEQTDFVQLAVLDDKTGTELSLTELEASGKIGTNGVAIRKEKDRYLLYLITNYDVDRIYCYDVTDPQAPVPDESFGTGGFIDLATVTKAEEAEGTCIVFDDDGSFYLTANLGSGNKGDSVLHISADGKKVLDQVELHEAYGLDLDGEYLFVSTYLDAISSVHVLNKNSLKEVAEVGNMEDCTQYADVVYANDRLYIADQTWQEGSRILRSHVLSDSEK